MRTAKGERLTARWAMRPSVWHAAFWAIHIANELMVGLAEQRVSLALLSGSLRVFAVLALASYVNLLLLVPRLWRRGHRATHAVLFILTCTFIALVWVAIWRPVPILDASGIRAVARWTLTCMMYAGYVAALDVAARHVRAARERAEREREHAQRRLDHLRAQLHPHFLFNTLNSLYSLAIARSPVLPDMILQHAGLLRYALEQTRHAHVPLAEEVEFLDAYVALERLRLSDQVEVRMEVEGIVGSQRIAPMVFAPLVENCFKHLGAEGAACFVHISLEIAGEMVRLTLRNSYDSAGGGGAGKRTGIGLRNMRERLTLLYPGRHRLETQTLGGIFKLELSLEL